MKTNSLIILVFCTLGLMLTTCSNLAQSTPTVTPEPTETPQPTATSTFTPVPTDTPLPTATTTFTPIPTDTPSPTDTPEPTHTPTPTVQPTLAMGDVQIVAEGGFSFQAPVGYDVEVDRSQVGVFDRAGTIIISITGVTADTSGQSPEEVVDEFLNAMAASGDGEFVKEASHPVMIGGVEGIAFDLTGSLFGSSLRGQAVLVMPETMQIFFGLGIANTSSDEGRWEDEGELVFTALLDSILFIVPESTEVPEATEVPGGTGACPVSTDESYGYTQGNPIRVGGGAFEGPPRERAYLDNLQGPNGESVSYERIGSTFFEDMLLDIFEVRGLTQSVTLYIDEYSYSELKAPVGFVCVAAFPLSEP